MKEFLKVLFIEPFTDGHLINYLLGIIIWCIGIFMLVFLLSGITYFIDSSFLKIEQDNGLVIDKYIVPQHSTTTMVMSGKTMIPIIIHHDNSYQILVKIHSLTDIVYLKKEHWDRIEPNQVICFQYTNGRILKSLYIKSFCNE